MIYMNITKFVVVNELEKDHSLIETRCLKKYCSFYSRCVVDIRMNTNCTYSDEDSKKITYFG